MCYNLAVFILVLLLNIQLQTAAEITYNCTQPPNLINFDVNSCCRIPEINLGSIPEHCIEQINQLNSSNEKYAAFTHVCYPECIYRETGALVNGNIQIENVKRFLQRNVHRRDKDIVPHIVGSFEACLKNIKGHLSDAGLESYANLPQGCSPYASMIYSCVNVQTFLHCPTKMWKDEANCNTAKNFALQCNPLPHVPLPLN